MEPSEVHGWIGVGLPGMIAPNARGGLLGAELVLGGCGDGAGRARGGRVGVGGIERDIESDEERHTKRHTERHTARRREREAKRERRREAGTQRGGERQAHREAERGCSGLT